MLNLDQNWLMKAAEITQSDRQRDYGHPLPNFLRIAIKQSVTLEKPVSPLHVVLMSIDLKTAREQNTHKDDNYIDMMGYAATVERMDVRLKEMGYDRGIDLFKQGQTETDGMFVGRMFDLMMHAIDFDAPSDIPF